jgi:hypothetical protein
MGMTVWLNVRNGEKHESDNEDRSAILDLQDQIDALATSLGVEPLSTFFDETDLQYNMDDDAQFEESEDGWPASAASWHDPKDVLLTVEALCTYLEGNRNAITEADGWGQDDVLEDLKSLVPGLQAAAAAERTVHLLVVM